MFALLLAGILGLAIAFFAQQNTTAVPVTVGSYAFPSVPLYVVAVASLLFGLFIAWILSVMDLFSHSLHLRKKDAVINDTNKRVEGLEAEVSHLKAENAELRGSTGVEHIDHPTVSEKEAHRPSFFEQLRDRFAYERREGALS